MQDQYAGQAGTFVVDPDKGVRVPIEQYQAESAAKAPKNATPKDQPVTEG